MMRSLAPALLSAALLLGGCATNPVTGEQDFVLMSEERELELGRQFDERIREQFDVYEDEALQRYVQDLGERLAAQSHRPDIHYTFTVVDHPMINAFALPGGYIYVTTGILAYFNSEAELAGVLGHELGHVTARHAVQQQSAATATSILGRILLAETGAGQAGAQLFRIAQVAAMRGYGREQELQADRLGAQYLARAGYDPEQMLAVVTLLADQQAFAEQKAKEEGREPQGYHGVFATHPRNDARRQEVIRAAKRLEVARPSPPGHERYLRLLEGLPFGGSTEQGVIEDGVFLHRDLDVALEAPEGWTIANHPERLVFDAPDAAARLVVRLETEGRKRPPRTLLAERVDAALDDGHGITVGGFPGYTAVAEVDTGAGRRPGRHAVIVKGRQAWYFTGVAGEGHALERFDEHFLDIVRSLHALSPEERRRAGPLRIEVVTVRAGQTYADLAHQMPGRLDDPVARLRLLNGDWPDGEPEPGRLLKTLR